eukprot:PITA_27998
MSREKNIFNTLEEKDLEIQIEMGDEGKYHVSGEGMVVFQREHGSPLTLSNVMYVTGLKNNLMPIAMLEDKGYDVVFSLGKVEDGAALSSKAKVVHAQDIGELWHRRLGHLHHGALKIMQQISTGLPNCKVEQMSTCKGCTLGKYAKASFHDRDSRVGAVLECWIYFMQKKDQTFLKFCEFKALAEKESGMKIKALRIDNGGEYVSQQFKEFCASEGIKREFTAPHNPQQNGVTERKNRCIMGAARAMLHDQGLPLHLWDEACNTTVHLQNRSPHRMLGMKTPIEAF